ncbi:unnamed protein product, partial [Ceratitis capitata]
MDLSLTITPIIPASKDLYVSAIPSTNTDQFPPPPDLRFHCMCCSAFFVNPYILYQHMNSQHPQPLESKEEDKTASEDDDQDYSWVLEPLCEIVDMSGATRLKAQAITADPRESTSIILINSKAADIDNAMQTRPVHRNNVPVVYKPGR